MNQRSGAPSLSSRAFLLAVSFALNVMGCGGPGSRDAAAFAKDPSAIPKAWVPVQRSPAAVNAILPRAAGEMGLLAEEAPTDAGAGWVFSRGARLDVGGILYRVDVRPVPGQPDRCTIGVMAVMKDVNILETHETIAKPAELAFRIATLALSGDGR